MRNLTKIEKFTRSKTGIIVQLACSVIGIVMFVFAVIKNVESGNKNILMLNCVNLLIFIIVLLGGIKKAFKWHPS